jgi:hypothetical protein
MKQNRRCGLAEEFPELDHLVLSEIEAMVVDPKAQSSAGSQNGDGRKSTNDLKKIENSFGNRRGHQKRRARAESLSDWDEELEQSSVDNDLLSEEEQRFVADTAAWLRNRSNPDIIIASIWNHVVGPEAAVPDSSAAATAPESESVENDKGGSTEQ